MSMSQPSPGSQPSPTPEARGSQPKQPLRWNVVLLDDNDHSFPYVIRMLQELFYLNEKQAAEIADQIHTQGRAIVFTTHREHAELKVEQVVGFGRDPHLPSSKGAMSVVLEPVT
jgi:ATP-dependent Clp protease adaptor protein ClpS